MAIQPKDISLSAISKLAVPALIAGIAEPLLSIVDTAFVGNMDEFPTESLAAVGLVGTFLSMLIWILGQVRSAISTIVSQYLGANKLEEIKYLPAQAVYGVVALGLLLILITYPLAPFIFKLYNAENHILDFAVQYFRIRVFGLPFTLFTFAIFGTFRGLQNTFYPMLIAASGAILNGVLDYFLIYGVENWIPPMHLKGAAYASLIAQISMAILALGYLIYKTEIRLKLIFPFHPEMKTLVNMVMHLFVRTLALNVALFLGSAYATKYGKSYIAAYTIAINIWFFFAFFIDGLSSAGNIMAGKLYGGKQYLSLKILTQKLLKISTGVGIALALISAIFYQRIGLVFIQEKEVLGVFYLTFWMVLIMQPINGITFVLDGVFKGLGLMKYLRNVLLIATFIGFVPTLLILNYFDLKLMGIWVAFTVWMLLRGGLLLRKFYKLPFIQEVS
jgi:putative MATE family efflux protein